VLDWTNFYYFVLIQLSSWGWAQSCSKHEEDLNKHIIEEIVRQVGHLPELYDDARPEKHKKRRAVGSSTVTLHVECRAAGKSKETLAHKISILTSPIVNKYIKTWGHQTLHNSTLSKQQKPKFIIKLGDQQHKHCRLKSNFHISYRVHWIFLYSPSFTHTYIPSLSLLYWYPLSFFLQKSEL
jgi:hypothetical protein